MRHHEKRSLASGLAALSCVAALSLAAFSIPAPRSAAQDTASPPAEPAPPAGPPTARGRDRATLPVGQAGAVLELANGAKLLIPPALPIGSSRVLTFSTARGRLVHTMIHPRFVKIGPTLAFDGAINATQNPIVVSLRQRRFAQRANSRLVLAVEQPGICNDQNRRAPMGSSGLCSTWEVLEATYDATTGELQGRVPTPGGYRLQFGWVPAESASAAE